MNSISENKIDQTITLSREARIAGTVAFVDGIVRSGKSMMGPVLASFDRVEIHRMECIFEYAAGLYRIGKLERDAAVTLLKTEADEFLYDSMLARNINFHFFDQTSIWRNANRLRNLKRVFAKEHTPVLRRIARERPVFQTLTHDQLANFDIHREAFGEDFRMVHMIRHPTDMVTSWLRRGWGTRFGSDPLALTLCIRYNGEDIPYYALGWESEYLTASPMGRVIRMITRLWDDNLGVYRSLTEEQKKQVLVIPFEEFIQRPDVFLQPIGDFLDSSPTRHTKPTLNRQRCPRTYSLAERYRKQEEIESQATTQEMAHVERLIEEYETLREESLVSLGIDSP